MCKINPYWMRHRTSLMHSVWTTVSLVLNRINCFFETYYTYSTTWTENELCRWKMKTDRSKTIHLQNSIDSYSIRVARIMLNLWCTTFALLAPYSDTWIAQNCLLDLKSKLTWHADEVISPLAIACDNFSKYKEFPTHTLVSCVTSLLLIQR